MYFFVYRLHCVLIVDTGIPRFSLFQMNALLALSSRQPKEVLQRQYFGDRICISCEPPFSQLLLKQNFVFSFVYVNVYVRRLGASMRSGLTNSGKCRAMAKLDEIEFIGAGLSRPEGVLTHKSGPLLTGDWPDSGGISLVDQDGVVSRILAKDAPRQMHPNGVALEPGGSILLADLGVEDGGVWRLHSDGNVEPVIIHIAGHNASPYKFCFARCRRTSLDYGNAS